ncbi:MAG: c-type cytochrome [Bryobacteraceae bacterium]|jgi:mono/diheme cytochrome c family protein
MKLQTAVLAATVFAISLQAASSAPTLQLRKVSSNSGQEMFAAWCAACHGLDGKGDGYAASGLKKTPPDLTMLAARNGGKFPGAQVVGTVLEGSGSMTAWGPILAGRSSSQGEAQIRLGNIVSYLRSIQK